VTTVDGNLVLSTKPVKTSYWEKHENGDLEKRVKNYTSGMVQSWNKFCFTGGILEMSIELPGEAESGG
jgi:beta-glucanase (GH16 family)